MIFLSSNLGKYIEQITRQPWEIHHVHRVDNIPSHKQSFNRLKFSYYRFGYIMQIVAYLTCTLFFSKEITKSCYIKHLKHGTSLLGNYHFQHSEYTIKHGKSINICIKCIPLILQFKQNQKLLFPQRQKYNFTLPMAWILLVLLGSKLNPPWTCACLKNANSNSHFYMF